MSKTHVFAALLLCLAATATDAHDGGFGHSRRTLYLTTDGDKLVLEYRLQHNRDDALVEMTLMDADGDGTISAEEKERFLKARAKQLADNLRVQTAAGDAVTLRFEKAQLDQGLTQTYRFTLDTKAAEVLLEDRNFSHKPGLVQVRNSDGLSVTLVSQTDLTHAERVSLRVKRVGEK